MGYEELVDAVRDHGGLSSRSQAEATIRAVFGAIARRVLSADRRAVKALMPAPLDAVFDQEEESGDVSIDAIVKEVAGAEHIALGFGREHLGVVGAAATEKLHADAVTALRTHLPDEVAALFEPRRRPRVSRPTPLETPRRGRHLSEAGAGSGRHLADARPGSARPLSEAEADRAHRESVARSDEPHADTKLSSAEGMTQVREHESLSEGKD